MSIKFYSTKGSHGCSSNFSAHAIDVDGRRWPTSEHYFQAQKFADAGRQEAIRRAEAFGLPRAADGSNVTYGETCG